MIRTVLIGLAGAATGYAITGLLDIWLILRAASAPPPPQMLWGLGRTPQEQAGQAKERGL